MPCRPSFCQHELSTAVGRAYRTMPCVFLHAGQLLDEGVDAVSNLIADRPDLFECLAGRVVEFPVLVVLAGQERTGVAAAHRDDDIGSQDELVGHGLENSREMSMPTSAIAASTPGLMPETGSESPD